MVVAGTQDAVLMVESEAKELTEDQMLGAVLYAHQEMQTVVQAVSELAAEAAKPRWDWQAAEINQPVYDAVKDLSSEALGAAYRITDKMQRQTAVEEAKAQALTELVSDDVAADTVAELFKKVEKDIVRSRILAGEARIDGRDNHTVRGLVIEADILPNTHGSAIFTRGETQSIGVVTLGSTRDSQMIDALEGTTRDGFMLHYNFPPYSVGEAGRMGPPGRREIGHGRLARRGIAAMLPSQEDFPYTIRVVSEITESNGSSSMASVCSASLALMDAGVPLKHL